MIFVDTNVFVYAVGRDHPLKKEARAFFDKASKENKQLVSSAEVMQELLHIYLPVQRYETLNAAFELFDLMLTLVLSVDKDAVNLAKALNSEYPKLDARDLIHVSVCRLHAIMSLKTFDRNLASIFPKI